MIYLVIYPIRQSYLLMIHLFLMWLMTNTSANELNNDLKKVSNWAFQWKMSFNPDPSKLAQEVIFSRKLKKSNTPSFGLY